LLVNDIQEIRYQAMPSQWLALRMQIKQSCVIETVFVLLNPEISLREEVGFFRYPKSKDTHYPNIQGDLKSCVYM